MVAMFGEQRIDEGRVVRTDGGSVVVALNPDCAEPQSCERCHGKDSCMKSARPSLCTIPAADAGQYGPGEQVRVSRFAVNSGTAALLVFGLPLAFAVLALVVQQSFTERPAESAWAILAVIAGFAAGFVVSAGADRLIRRLVPGPRIISTVHGTGPGAQSGMVR